MINEILLEQARRELRELEDNPNIRRELIGDYCMAMDNKEKQAAYVERMKEQGYKRASVWISPESQKMIEKTRKEHELRRDEAIDYLILRN